MNFDLNEEQRIMVQTVSDFATKEILPNSKKEEFDLELVKRMGSLGFFGCAFPVGLGGSDLGFLAHSIICELISTYDSGLRSLFNLQGLTVPYTIMEWGSDTIRRKYVKALVTAERLGCTCFSEPNAGSDISGIVTEIEDKGNYYL